MLRKPVYAGRFYPGSAQALKKELASLVSTKTTKTRACGIIAPHAGYMYSGSVAGEIYSKTKLPDKFIILSPNHTGVGAKISLFAEGSWETPLGSVEVDTVIAQKIKQKYDVVKDDVSAHMMEHSLEVQIPFIQHFKENFTIVPFTLSHLSIEDCKKLGDAIAEAIKEAHEDILIVASSDMTHYESASKAKEKDKLAIDRVLDVDPEGLFKIVRENGISMCGVIPSTVMLFAAKKLGAKKGTLVKYANSGDVSGDYDEVVGYAGLYVN